MSLILKKPPALAGGAVISKQMGLVRGTPVTVHKEGMYLQGYLLREDKEDTKRVWVQLQSKHEVHLRTNVYWLYRGTLQPLSCSSTSKQPKKYNGRKDKENNRLIYDTISLGFDIGKSQLLTLDDFRKGGKRTSNKKATNTMGMWIRAGGAPNHVWVPNPDPDVTRAVNSTGGHGYAGTLFTFLQQHHGTKFDVLYLDFCGFWSTNRSAIELLFHRRLMSEEKALLHVTFCKREGAGVMEEVFSQLTKWCDEYGYGRCSRFDMAHSETMWKGAFVIGRRVFCS